MKNGKSYSLYRITSVNGSETRMEPVILDNNGIELLPELFKLSKAGEALAIISLDEKIMVSITIRNKETDRAYWKDIFQDLVGYQFANLKGTITLKPNTENEL